jgi:hypothetical protein
MALRSPNFFSMKRMRLMGSYSAEAVGSPNARALVSLGNSKDFGSTRFGVEHYDEGVFTEWFF